MPVYSQYMMNGFIINSAIAGYDGFTSFDFTSRQQWLGFQNAPRTFSISAQTRLLKRSFMIKTRPKKSNRFIPARKGRVGLGIHVFTDRNGYFTQTGATMAYSYHIPFPNSQLSFGVSATYFQLSADATGFIFRDKEDPIIKALSNPVHAPDANTGIYYMNRDFYIGFSAANLLESNLKFNSDLEDYQLKRHYYLMAGYQFYERANIIYEPSILLKTTEQLMPQVDLTMKLLYYDKYWFGLSYRTASTAIVFMGFKKNYLYIGYAFDYSFNTFQKYSWGSHELNLALKFGDSAKRYRWVNRF